MQVADFRALAGGTNFLGHGFLQREGGYGGRPKAEQLEIFLFDLRQRDYRQNGPLAQADLQLDVDAGFVVRV